MRILFLPMAPLLPVLLLQRGPLLGRVPGHGTHDEGLVPHRPRHGAAGGRGRGDRPRPRDGDGRGVRGPGRRPRRPRAHGSDSKDAVSTDTAGLNPAAAFNIRATITCRLTADPLSHPVNRNVLFLFIMRIFFSKWGRFCSEMFELFSAILNLSEIWDI